MARFSTTLDLPAADDTDLLGQTLARYARAGDCILLRGQIGAGKSALARAFIRALLGEETEVPSPTFTLVQTYDHDNTEIWHADLYRLSDPQEVVELGLADAMATGICLIEWPELLGDLTPHAALDIALDLNGEGRTATITYGPGWADRMKQVVDA